MPNKRDKPATKPKPTAEADSGHLRVWVGAGIGAGIGSAAVAAALLYANRMKKVTPPPKGPREPE